MSLADYESFSERHLRRNKKTVQELLASDQFVRPVRNEEVQQLRRYNYLERMLVKRHQRNLTKEDKLKVIGLRYGSLSNFDVPVRTYYNISKSIHIPYATVRRFLLRFEARQGSLEQFLSKKQRRFLKIPRRI